MCHSIGVNWTRATPYMRKSQRETIFWNCLLDVLYTQELMLLLYISLSHSHNAVLHTLNLLRFQFRFWNQAQEKTIDVLSGGERNRVHLAKTLKR